MTEGETWRRWAETRDLSRPAGSRYTGCNPLTKTESAAARSSHANATAAVPDERLARSALGVVWNQRWQLLVSADCSL